MKTLLVTTLIVTALVLGQVALHVTGAAFHERASQHQYQDR